MSFECPYGGGHHIFEDAFVVEVVDPDTYEPVEPGEVGCLIATALYKDAYPVIRYDTKDMTRLWPQGDRNPFRPRRNRDPCLRW